MALNDETYYYIFTDNQRIVGDNDGGTLKAHSSHASAGKYFLEYERGKYFSLWSKRTRKYVCAANEGHVTANRGKRKEWELFEFDGTADTWGKIVCNRDDKPWYTKDEGAIHHKDHTGTYLFVPCDMVVTKRCLQYVTSLTNPSAAPAKLRHSLTVGFSSSVSQTESLKVAAGFVIEKVFKLDIEATQSVTTTSTESTARTITVEASVSPGEAIEILQEVAYAPAGFSYSTGHYEVRNRSQK